MARRGSSRGGGARTVALVASGVFHAVLLAFLVRQAARDTPAYQEPPSIQATLVTPDRPTRIDRGRVRRRPLDAPDPLARAAAMLPVPPPVTPLSPDGGAAPSSGGSSSEAEVAARARQALRGCARAELTREQREDCEARRWADAAPVTARLNLDLAGRYAKNPEPFLSRRPTKGCRARITGDVDGMGNDMNARAGVTCVKPF